MLMRSWNPWSLFDELERAMLHTAGSSEGSRFEPRFEIDDSEDETVLYADVPGMTTDDLEVFVQGPLLIVRGERKQRHGRGGAPRHYGAFERRFRVGELYDLDDVKAHVQDGVLTITLAKAAKAKPRRVKLTTGVIDKVKGLLSGGKDKGKEHEATA
jgi:HSP20 family protein